MKTDAENRLEEETAAGWAARLSQADRAAPGRPSWADERDEVDAEEESLERSWTDEVRGNYLFAIGAAGAI